MFSGYGNVAPKTSGGRLFCILYGLCGIPLCLTWISELGTFFGGRAKRLSQVLLHRSFTVVRTSLTKLSLFKKTNNNIINIPIHVFSFTTEKSTVHLHSCFPFMGFPGSPDLPSLCIQSLWGLDLLRRPVLLFHHLDDCWFWWLCSR